jgi:hypothetical protein
MIQGSRPLPDCYFEKDGIVYWQYKYLMQKILEFFKELHNEEIPKTYKRLIPIEDQRYVKIIWEEIKRYLLIREEMDHPIPVKILKK